MLVLPLVSGATPSHIQLMQNREDTLRASRWDASAARFDRARGVDGPMTSQTAWRASHAGTDEAAIWTSEGPVLKRR